MDFFVVFERFQMGHHFCRPRQLDGQAFFEHDRDARNSWRSRCAPGGLDTAAIVPDPRSPDLNRRPGNAPLGRAN
jgi:hypothetical protein